MPRGLWGLASAPSPRLAWPGPCNTGLSSSSSPELGLLVTTVRTNSPRRPARCSEPRRALGTLPQRWGSGQDASPEGDRHGGGGPLGSTCKGGACRRGCGGHWPRPERHRLLAVTQPRPAPPQPDTWAAPAGSPAASSTAPPPLGALLPGPLRGCPGRALSALQEGPRAGSGRPASRGAAPRPHTATSRLAHTGPSTAGGDPGYWATGLGRPGPRWPLLEVGAGPSWPRAGM